MTRDEARALDDLSEKFWSFDHQSFDHIGYAQAVLEIATGQAGKDALTMAMRLYLESDDTFAPETLEVMSRWRPKVDAALQEVA